MGADPAAGAGARAEGGNQRRLAHVLAPRPGLSQESARPALSWIRSSPPPPGWGRGRGGGGRSALGAEVCKLPSERGGGASPVFEGGKNLLKAHPLGTLPRGPGKADRGGLWERGRLSVELPQKSRLGVGFLIALGLLRPFPLPDKTKGVRLQRNTEVQAPRGDRAAPPAPSSQGRAERPSAAGGREGTARGSPGSGSPFGPNATAGNASSRLLLFVCVAVLFCVVVFCLPVKTFG